MYLTVLLATVLLALGERFTVFGSWPVLIWGPVFL